MKRMLFAVATLTAIAGAAPSYAQGVVVEIDSEQRAIIHDYVVRQRPRAVVIPGDVRVGAVLPGGCRNQCGPE